MSSKSSQNLIRLSNSCWRGKFSFVMKWIFGLFSPFLWVFLVWERDATLAVVCARIIGREQPNSRGIVLCTSAITFCVWQFGWGILYFYHEVDPLFSPLFLLAKSFWYGSGELLLIYQIWIGEQIYRRHYSCKIKHCKCTFGPAGSCWGWKSSGKAGEYIKSLRRTAKAWALCQAGVHREEQWSWAVHAGLRDAESKWPSIGEVIFFASLFFSTEKISVHLSRSYVWWYLPGGGPSCSSSILNLQRSGSCLFILLPSS